MVRMARLPDGYRACVWCDHPIRLSMISDTNRCPRCQMIPHADDTAPLQVDKATSKRTRTQRARTASWNLTPHGRPVLGIDPGARYTGVVVRDGDAVLLATTLMRDTSTSATAWAVEVVDAVRRVADDHGLHHVVAVEGVSDPKGFKGGAKDPINPAWIMRAAVVLGAVVGVWPDAVVVKPGGNGSKHPSAYPPMLVGRRPKDLAGDSGGAGTRGHEQSAYDVAGKAAPTCYARLDATTADNAVMAPPETITSVGVPASDP